MFLLLTRYHYWSDNISEDHGARQTAEQGGSHWELALARPRPLLAPGRQGKGAKSS